MIWIFKFSISSILTFSLIWFGILNSHEVDFYLVPKFFDFDNPLKNPIELRTELVDEMFDNGGVGLSANQVGYDCSVFVMKGQNKEQSMFIANPEILEVSEDKVLIEEGCLTNY